MSLPQYGGRDVIAATIKVTKTGDGLSDAMKVEPVALNHGAQVYLVVKCDVVDVQHPYADKKRRDTLLRKHVLEANEVAIVDEAEVAELLIKNRDRVQRGLDSMVGQSNFDDLDDE